MPRVLVFVAPILNEPTLRFVRALRRLEDVRLLGVVRGVPEGDDAALFDDVARVADPFASGDVLDGVEVLRRRHGEPHRILGILEGQMVSLAEVRERLGVPGTPVRTAVLFREKAQMKDALRAAGLPVARHKVLEGERDARAFAEDVGFPMVLKPTAGVGARSTFRVRSLEGLLQAISALRVAPDAPMLAEELIVGRERSFETITIGGLPRVASFAEYIPGPLEVLENPWIQWACILPREIDTPLYAHVRELGLSAVRALGLDDGMTHMEWYERPDGSVAIGEIAQRPPGPQLCQMTGLVHDVDIYRAWARAVVDGELDARWERKYAAGTAFVRGVGRGRVASVTGVREVYDAIAPWLVEARLPTLGASKSDSYEGDGYVVVRAETTEKVRQLITTIIETLRIRYA